MVYNSIMKYDKQRYKFVYAGDSKGHVFGVGSDVGFCGIEIVKLKKLGRISRVKNWREHRELCDNCMLQLKNMLQKEYCVEGW